jgi:hypothetical protein
VVQRAADASNDALRAAPASVVEAVSGSGSALQPGLQRDMERRLGADLAGVRIHTGALAHRSAREIHAHAYTVGRDVVFADGRFAPATRTGRWLLAHELAHVVQQSGHAPVRDRKYRSSGAFAQPHGVVQRFSDKDHHVLEEAALKGVFTDEQVEAIEQGNMRRDYSQAPAFANALLLGKATRFGGYARHEHFDNFIFDRAKDRWVTHEEYDRIWDDQSRTWVKRKAPRPPKRSQPRITAPQYIAAELLAAVQNDMPDSAAFEHLGNAFHTVEDFFAHSNFVELTEGDLTHGEELTTHPPGVGGPGSEASILGTVSDPASAAYINEAFRADQENAPRVSHGAMAKDFHGNRNHELAITLAALVIRQVAIFMKEAFALGARADREAFVRDTVIALLTRYLRPPSDRDKWWETLQAEDRGNTLRRIRKLQEQTPVTVNQSPGSPLRNIEATRFSSWKALGTGTSVSIPLGGTRFLTIGHMLYLPGTGVTPTNTGIVLPPYVSDRDEKVRIVSGLQFTGTFDETKWFR